MTTIIVFNKPLNEFTDNPHSPLFSIYTNAEIKITPEFIEVMGTNVDRWHGLKVGMEHVSGYYQFIIAKNGLKIMSNEYPKTNNTCS